MKHCKVTGCHAPVIAKGLCWRHYARLRHHGTTELMVPRRPLRFKNYGAQLLYKAAHGNVMSLVRKIGLPHNELSHYIHGRRQPTLDKAILMQERAGVPMLTWKARPVRA
jgi:hypothetical protein